MIANEFATPVGVAQAMTILPQTEKEAGSIDDITIDTKEGREAYKSLNEELRINRITLDAIKRKKYRALTRGVFLAKLKNPKWSDRRAYSHTWRTINNKVTAIKECQPQ